MAIGATPIGKILSELGVFITLALASESIRLILRRQLGTAALVLQRLHVCTLVLCWYSVSITLVLYNKWVLAQWRGNGLPFPLFYTMSHMALKGVFSSSYLLFTGRCCDGALPKPNRRVFMGACLVGVMTGLDVAASNLSFVFISVAFYTMLKSASLIFILVMATAVRVERCSLQIALTIIIICGGIFLASFGEASFDMTGFALVALSELFAAIRWIATQVILQEGNLDAMTAVFYMSPASTLSLGPLVIARERAQLAELSDVGVFVDYLLIAVFPGFLAFLLLLVEVQLVKETSSLTLSVFGNLKSIVTIIVAIVIFGERTTLMQWCGLTVALGGMFAYSFVKNRTVSIDALAQMEYERLLDDDLDADARTPRILGEPTFCAEFPPLDAALGAVEAEQAALQLGEVNAEDGQCSKNDYDPPHLVEKCAPELGEVNAEDGQCSKNDDDPPHLVEKCEPELVETRSTEKPCEEDPLERKTGEVPPVGSVAMVASGNTSLAGAQAASASVTDSGHVVAS